jgi:hypothetical protein
MIANVTWSGRFTFTAFYKTAGLSEIPDGHDDTIDAARAHAGTTFGPLGTAFSYENGRWEYEGDRHDDPRFLSPSQYTTSKLWFLLIIVGVAFVVFAFFGVFRTLCPLPRLLILLRLLQR